MPLPQSGCASLRTIRGTEDHGGRQDGKTLYFISNQGSSFLNLWGVRFDPDCDKTIGAPFAIATFDSPGIVITLMSRLPKSVSRLTRPAANDYRHRQHLDAGERGPVELNSAMLM